MPLDQVSKLLCALFGSFLIESCSTLISTLDDDRAEFLGEKVKVTKQARLNVGKEGP